MKKITSIIMYVLLAVSVLSLIPIFLYGEDGLDFALIWTYMLLGLGILSAVVMSVINIGKNPSGAKSALIGLAVMAVVLLVSYLMSSTDPVSISGDKKEYSDTLGLLATDIGLFSTYFVLIAAFVVVIFGEIRNSIK